MEKNGSESRKICKKWFCIFGLRAPTLKQLWWSFPLFFAAVRGFLAPLGLLDFYWHLRIGQVIVETLSIPRTDIFSFTAAGKEFIDQSWLADVLFYIIYKAGGFALVVFGNGILLSLILLPLSFLCRKAGPKTWSSVFPLFLVAFCLPWNLRPQIYSSALFSFFYWILWSYRSKASSAIYALPVLMIVWVNLHGAFPIGLGLIVIFLAVELIELLVGGMGDAASTQRLKVLALILVLCFVATMANPELYGVYDYVLSIMKSASVQKYVTEWQPPAVSSSDGFTLFYLPFFLLTLAFIVSSRRPSLLELSLYAAFSAYGLMALRNCVWFVIVSAPMLARHLPSIDWSFIHPKPAASALRLSHPHARRKELASLNRVIALAMIVVFIMHSPWVKMRLQKSTLQSPDTPVGAMDFIERNWIQGNIFHPQLYGDYLIWRLWPEQRSFFDGRVHLFDEAFVKEYSKVLHCAEWEALLAKYDIKYLLLPKGKQDEDMVKLIEAARYSGRWAARYEDDIAVLFERMSGCAFFQRDAARINRMSASCNPHP
ncbi:MAG: hypothetical protein JXA73_23370 [Acidobacteria bacterium]|nr:hypothetical protein [Acidobacteriota bacterium]